MNPLNSYEKLIYKNYLFRKDLFKCSLGFNNHNQKNQSNLDRLGNTCEPVFILSQVRVFIK